MDARTGNSYGKDPQELSQVLADLRTIEPLLRRSADLVLTVTGPPRELADELLRRVE